ncbi:hypothetical protein HDZ31DRAFT_40296 [Schizophyllum fasciatum]
MRLFIIAAFGAFLLILSVLLVFVCLELKRRARRRNTAADLEASKVESLPDFSKMGISLPDSPRSTFSVSSDPFRRSLRSAFAWDRAVTPHPLRLEESSTRKGAGAANVLHKKPPSLSTSVRNESTSAPMASPTYRSPLSHRPQQTAG